MNRHRETYRKCLYCKGSFTVKYIKRHLATCKSQHNNIDDSLESDDSDNDLTNLIDNSSVSFQMINQNNLPLNDQDEYNDNELHLDETLVDEITFHELVNDEDDSIYQSGNGTAAKSFLVKWLCLFLALWQKAYTITDSALEKLLKFLKLFFGIIPKYMNGAVELASDFPTSLYSFRKYLKVDSANFAKYVVCRKCFKLYSEDECKLVIRGELLTRKCTHRAYPNHTQIQHRGQCSEPLMYKLTSFSGKSKLVAFKYYIYKSFKTSFSELLEKDSFEKACQSWRERTQEEDVLEDVYDGDIWKRFSGFLEEPRSFAFMINVDWFCPYKFVRSYSVGAIYLACLNLPRAERFKEENIILVGLIPNMKKEPPLNTFLRPLIEEFYTAWYDGFKILSKVDCQEHIYKAALVCVGCDIPATRKLCGFLGHSATVGCSKCKKNFPGNVGNKNYGGFNREDWQRRTNEEHRREMAEILRARTKGEQETLERRYGTRYTVLSVLPYFDCIDMVTVDPMHNLFLGTSKLMSKIWSEKGYFSKNNLEIIQRCVDSAKCASDIGKLPKKIDSFSFDGFTADEFKNWTIIFSLYALKDIIPHDEIECWRKFVLACLHLCCRAITKANVVIADSLLLQFCQQFERLYPGRVTPNMHMHLHIIDCINAFGPIYSFWLFSFERYNGILGSYPSKNRNIECQLMRRFEQHRRISNQTFPLSEREYFISIFNQLLSEDKVRGTLSHINHYSSIRQLKLSSRNTDFKGVPWYDNTGLLNSSTRPSLLNSAEHESLISKYSTLYPNHAIIFKVHQSCWKFSDITIGNEKYSSLSSRTDSSSYITAFWCGDEGSIQSYETMYLQPRPGKINFFIKHTLEVEKDHFEHFLACVNWYLLLEDSIANHYGKPVKMWRNHHFELKRASYLIPVRRIKSKFVPVETRFRHLDVLVALPRDRFLNV